jgi:putative transposase
VLDLFNREVVGWSIKPRMTADIVTDALTMAWFRRRPEPGALHHSDRGSQYASDDFQRKLAQYGMRCSMSRKGNCWDTQSKIRLERRTDLTRVGIGRVALALTCRSGSGVPRVLPGPAFVT